jgi:hypothetical protein
VNVPAGHGSHCACPLALPYHPGWHATQRVDAAVGLALPGGQALQAALSSDMPASMPYVPVGHGAQAVTPLALLKLPAGGWPAALAVPGPHDRQLALPLDPSLGLYVPAGHGVQLLPGCAEYVPG